MTCFSIVDKSFEPSMQVLFFNSCLKLFPGKLKSRWSGPYEVGKVFPYRAVKLKHKDAAETFKVNGQRLKQYFGMDSEKETVESMSFRDF